MGGMPNQYQDDFFGAQLAGDQQAQQQADGRSAVNDIYQKYLGRDAEEGAYEAHWKNAKGNLGTIEEAIKNSPEAQAYSSRTRTAQNPGEFPGTGGTVIQPDLFNLRNVLGAFLQDKIANWKPEAYGGDLSMGLDPMFGDAASMYRQGLDATNRDLEQFQGDLNPLRQLSQTGGAPDIVSALEGIRTKGMMDIEDQSAQIREKFGRMGLGHSSDISEYLGRGVSRGVADINSQQSQLIASIMDSAANRKLSAAQGLAGANTGMAGLRAGAYGQAAGGLAGIGAASQSVKEGNLSRQYAEFVRMQQPNPYLASATGYATGFAPPKPVIPEQGGNNMAGFLAALGPIGAALIGLSDRNVKEDIRPIKASNVEAALASLPIYNWKYKGSPTPHIGPMAQDFQKAFGVGDGRNIALIDVMGVLLASQKAVMERFAHA